MKRERIVKMLREKLNLNWNDYMWSLLRLSKGNLIEKSDEISATRFVYNALYGGGYQEDYMEYLLRFENPLELARDQWISERKVNFSEELNHALWNLMDKDDEGQYYALDKNYTPVSEMNKAVTVREFIEEHPDATFDIMTPGVYVYLTPEKAQILLSGHSVMGHAGHRDYAMEVTAEELLNQEVRDANLCDGIWYMLSRCSQETEQNQTSFEQGVTMC